MKSMSFARIASAATGALLGAAVLCGAAEAGTGNWYGTANGPTLYQTNYWYNSGNASPSGSVPATAKVTSLSWVVNLSYYPATVNTQIIGATSGTGWNVGSTISGSTTVSPTVPANQSFYFQIKIAQGTTHTLSPTVVGGGHQLNINYQY